MKITKKPLLTIWDIDKTLYNGYAIIDFGIYLETVGKFDKGFKAEILESKQNYESGKISYEEFAQNVYRIYGSYLSDKNMYEILQLSKAFWEEAIKNKLYPAAMDLHKFLNTKGSEHVAMSGSSFESLYYLADTLGFVKIKTTEYETIDGNFTNKIVSKLVSHYDKSRIRERVIRQKNKYEIVVGVGDNFADSAFLELVDVAIVMGTEDQNLIELPKNKGWKIIADKYSQLNKLDLSSIL